MNTKKRFSTGIALSAMLLMSTMAMAQQQKPVLPINSSQKKVQANANTDSYSYKLYSAPNNMYGYNIYKDGKPVYHQFALMYISKEGKRLVATKLQAEKAAAIAIEKIKGGQPPLLSANELEKIVAL